MKKKKIFITDLFLIVVLVSIAIVAWWATKTWAITERLALVSIIIGFMLGVIPVINSLFSENPKFEVSNPRVELERSKDRVSRKSGVMTAETGKTENGLKVVYIDIKNKNPDANLEGCKVTIATKLGKWDIENLGLIPDVSKPICLFIISARSSVVLPYQSKNKVELDVGRVYDLDLRFFGESFVNKKRWHLELDLTSWDSCNIRFKTPKEVLKEKIRGRKDE